MKEEQTQSNAVDDSKELVVIDYFDRIHNQWIKVEVTKEVARLLSSTDKKIKRSDNRYNKYNLSFDEVFDSNKEDYANERYLIDESAEINLEREEEQRLQDNLIDQQRTIIQNSLETLTDEQKEVVDRILNGNKTNREISNEIGVSEKAVSARKIRAYKNIKKYLSDTQN